MSTETRQALSAKLRAETRQAIQEREVCGNRPPAPPVARGSPRNRSRASPPKLTVREGLQRHLDSLLKPSSKPSPAPILCRRRTGIFDSHLGCPSGVAPYLHLAYALWAEHHAACETCSWQDWYLPGDIREVKDPLYAEYRFTDNGVVRYYRRGPDVSVLCAKGAALFTQWETVAARAPGTLAKEGT